MRDPHDQRTGDLDSLERATSDAMARIHASVDKRAADLSMWLDGSLSHLRRSCGQRHRWFSYHTLREFIDEAVSTQVD
jgi:hypothetical protein